MPLVPSFSKSAVVGSPNIVRLTDTSTGSDVLITSRRVYLVNNLGNYIFPLGNPTNYVSWDLIDTSIDIDCLLKDMSLSVMVQWLDVGNGVLYTSTQLLIFDSYNETFYYSLTQYLSSNPSVIQDANYYSNKMKFRVEMDSASYAVSLGSDISAAQNCLDRATYLRINQAYYF